MKVQITIRGRTYTVRSDEDDIDLQVIARYVDGRMSEVADRTPPGIDDYTVALLSCLNIASDFERFRRSVGVELSALDKDLAASEAVLRAALPSGHDDAARDAPIDDEPSADDDDPDALDAPEAEVVAPS